MIMSNLLNTIVLFGKEFDWTLENALFWLLIVQVALIMFMVLVFAVLLKRVGHNRITVNSKPEERTLQGISLDLEMVKRNFAVGEAFDCGGLLISATYNLAPTSEIISDYAVITQDQLDALSKGGAIDGCFVVAPDTSAEGKVSVVVHYHGEQTAYVVEVGAQSEEPVEYTAVAEERTVIGLDLDLGVVQRDFTVGDEFNCDGLVINAKYNYEPKEEIITEYTVIDKETFDGIASEELSGCYVIKPSLAEAGKVAVTVRYLDKTAVYMVVAKEEVIEELPAEIIEEPEEIAVIERKPIGISLDFSFVQREFTQGDEFNCDGLIVNVNYDVEPLTESLVEYSVVDEQAFEELSSDVEGCYVIKPDLTKTGKQMVSVRYQKLTSYYTIAVAEPKEEEKPERLLLYITVNTDAVKKDFVEGDPFTDEGLIVTAHFNLEPLEANIENYSIVAPDMTKAGSPNVSVQYQDRTVGYRINIAARPEEEKSEESVEESVVAPIVVPVQHGPVEYEEESYEGGVLRYDKSFTARYIQSDDEIKSWYTKLKNELLSYKKVKSRISWKRETFRFGKETVARLGYRGNTLCIFLPLNAADYEDSRYKVEDVSDNNSYADTPCMYRLKNEKRVRLAIDLFATVMEKLGGVRIERIAEDYYLPYEGVVQLIDKGLIKRVIKDKADEAIFQRNATAEPTEEATADAQPAEVAVEQPVDAQPVEQIEDIPAESVFEDAPKGAEEPVAEAEASVEELSSEAVETPIEAAEAVEEPVEDSDAQEEASVMETAEVEDASTAESQETVQADMTEEAGEISLDEEPIEETPADETNESESADEAIVDEVSEGENSVDEASDDENSEEENSAEEISESEISESGNGSDSSSGPEQRRFNGKNRKKHRARK